MCWRFQVTFVEVEAQSSTICNMFDHVQHNMDDMKTDVFFVKSKCFKNGKTRDSGNQKKNFGRENIRNDIAIYWVKWKKKREWKISNSAACVCKSEWFHLTCFLFSSPRVWCDGSGTRNPNFGSAVLEKWVDQGFFFIFFCKFWWYFKVDRAHRRCCRTCSSTCLQSISRNDFGFPNSSLFSGPFKSPLFVPKMVILALKAREREVYFYLILDRF